MIKPLAVTMGEPAGIGGEILLRAYAERQRHALPPFVVYDDPERLRAIDENIALQLVASPAEAVKVFTEALPVIAVKLHSKSKPGQPDSANAPAVIASIRRAVEAVQNNGCAAIVTNPIQKSTLQAAGFKHPGHTEFLAELAGNNAQSVMLLATHDLRVVPATVHLPLKDVAAALSKDKIVSIAIITAAELQKKFGITSPRLAIAGLNPHAGEDGRMGDEEEKIIKPAVAELQRRGLAVTGPHAADALFHAEARKHYDCVICMYHDQALIPLKTLDFWGGVNVTLGLPFIRTSPDHGTALNIAGTGKANPASLIAALKLAEEMAKRTAA